MLRKINWIILFITVGVLIGLTTANLQAQKIKIKKGGNEAYVFNRDGDAIKAVAGAHMLEIEASQEGWRIRFGDEEFRVKTKGNKSKLYNPDGSLALVLKIKPNKIKISQSEDDPAPWSLKKKPDSFQYKVKKGDVKIGKIKFYPDKSKIKVKNSDKIEICSQKASRLTVATAVCLMDELTDKEKLLVFALICLNDL